MSTPSIPQVHLIIALDPHIPKGALLQSLEQLRCQFWQEEIVLLLDSKWQGYVGPEHAAIFIDAGQSQELSTELKMQLLDRLLNQLDELSLYRVSQIGDLGQARWLGCYFETRQVPHLDVLEKPERRAWAFINQLTRIWGLAIEGFAVPASRREIVVVDPYRAGSVSSDFLRIFAGTEAKDVPAWIRVLSLKKDRPTFSQLGLQSVVDEVEDYEVRFHDCRLVSFDPQSPNHLRSRTSRLCLISDRDHSPLMVPGDVQVHVQDNLDAVELFKILNWWRTDRLRELAGPVQHLGLEINELRLLADRLSPQNIQFYVQEQVLTTEILKLYRSRTPQMAERELDRRVSRILDQLGIDHSELAISAKVLSLICQRMRLSSARGERLFERLGSDYGRIRLGELIYEGLDEGIGERRLQTRLGSSLSDVSKFIDVIDQLAEKKLNETIFKETA